MSLSRCSRFSFSMIVCVLFWACSSVDDPLGDGSEPATRSDALILGALDWGPVREFVDDIVYQRGARYARASAKLGSVGCSGFLVDDDILITAEHCLANGTSSAVYFGWIGESWAEQWLAILEARERLADIGIPPHAVNALPTETFTRWWCVLDADQRDDGDVTYWECAPNRISWLEGSGADLQRIELDLFPGHVWGHMNVAPGERAEGTPMYVLSVNDHRAGALQQVLLSPNGWVSDDNASCFDWPWSDNNNDQCFNFRGADTRCGSSGGALVDANTHRVFGVVEGHATWNNAFGEDGCSFDVYGDSWYHLNTNIGSYISNQVFEYVDTPPSAWALGSWTGLASHWLGGTGGSYRGLYCPSHLLAAGVIGSTNDAADAVGTFGLVCVPHYDWDYQLDRAVVVSAGGRDTDFQIAYGSELVDLNTFATEVWSRSQTNGVSLSPQALIMCPPNYFLTGVTGHYDRSLHRVSSIQCEDPQTGNRTSRSVSNGRIGSWLGGRYERTDTSSCGANTYVAGLHVRSGWWIDGIRPYCRYED